jgi:hypothetical protein
VFEDVWSGFLQELLQMVPAKQAKTALVVGAVTGTATACMCYMAGMPRSSIFRSAALSAAGSAVYHCRDAIIETIMHLPDVERNRMLTDVAQFLAWWTDSTGHG